MTNKEYTGESTEEYYAHNENKMIEVAAKSGFAIPKSIYQLGVSPAVLLERVDDYSWIRNYGRLRR